MTSSSATVILNADRVRHVVCPACKSEESVSYRNSDGNWYCRCLTCACRFWAA